MSDLIVKEDIIKENEEQVAKDVAAGLDETEQSAAMFYHLAQIFRKEVYKLAKRKKRAPVRVLEALLFQPFEQVELSGAEERNLLDLCGQILYHKAKIAEYAEEQQITKENQSEQ